MTILREHVRSITTKGQVTIPALVRDFLGLRPGEKVIFRIVDERVELVPAQMTLEDAFGSVKPIQQPEDFLALRQIAREERVERILSVMQDE